MAKVKPDKPHSAFQEEYVLCSSVRSGLKREFAFALKAQADIRVSPVGRTRSGKTQHSGVTFRAKRRKKLCGGISPSDRIQVLSESTEYTEENTNFSVVGDVESIQVGELSGNEKIQLDNLVEESMPKNTASNLGGSNLGEISGEETIQSNCLVEEFGSEKTESSTEGCNYAKNEPSIQALTKPLHMLAQCDHVMEEPSIGVVQPIQVYSRSASKKAKRILAVDGSSINKVPSILVYRRCLTKMLQKSRLKGEASGVLPFSNHVENGPSKQCLSPIKVDESPLLEEESKGVNLESSIKVGSFPLSQVTQENYCQDEDYMEKITIINHSKEAVFLDHNLAIHADKTPLVDVAAMNQFDKEIPSDNISSIQAEEGTVEMVSAENNLPDLLYTNLVANDSLMNHVEEGASTEDPPSMQIEANPLKNCLKRTISADLCSVAESQYGSQRSHSEAENYVAEIAPLNKVEEGAPFENTSSVELSVSHEKVRGVYQKIEKNGMAEEPRRRFTRSFLKAEGKVLSGTQSLQEAFVPSMQILHSNNIEEGGSMKRTSAGLVKASDGTNVSHMDHAGDFIGTEMEKGICQKIERKVTFEEPVRRFTRSVLKADEKDLSETQSLLEDSISMGSVDDNSSVQADASHETTIEQNVNIERGFYQTNKQNVLARESLRRFTRSLLKVEETEQALPDIEEPLAVTTEVSLAVTSASDGVEEIKDLTDTVNVSEEPLQVTPKRKMELKMSKKIALSKLPSNVRDLFATGLLEGLPVKYRSHGYNKQGGLRGVIRGGGILCFCDACEGLNVVSAYNFELHAGSKKKHPSDFICLENGNTIHDVLRACATAPLDMLESTIQNAISPDGGILRTEKHRDFSFKSLPRRSESPTSPNLCQEAGCTPRPSKSIFPLKPFGSMQKYSSSQKGSRGRVTTKDLRLHKLVFMDDILPEGTEVAYYSRGQRLLDGYIKNSGIFCHCCSTVISPSLFEAHAGCSSRRKPYLNIYTSNGVSLHELSVSLSKGKKFSTSESDDLCRICGDGGDLLLCDICPRAYHKECVGVTNIPTEDWYCPCCQNMQLKDKSGQNNENAIAAGRVAGIDPIEEIFKRCIRIAKTPEANVGGCVLCRLHDFSRSDFGPRTVLLCDQCEREFHVGCLKEHDLADLKELPEGKWFCSPDCDRIHDTLEKLLASGEKMPPCAIDVIKKKRDDQVLGEDDNLDIRWRIFSGKSASPETRSFLSKALSIFYESFDPIVDFATKKDLIPAMVYGWDLMDQDFGGMFCAVLTVNSTVVSAAILRVLGREVAELPLVATSREYQGKGYFQSLFLSIEAFLDSLKVKHLVLPAAEEAEAIWTNKFGFNKISFDQLNEYMKGIRMLIFQGTSLLHKEVSGPPKPEEQASE